LRLGPVTLTNQPVPEEALRSLSASTLSGASGPSNIPQALRDLPGELTIFLANSEFVSFTGPSDANSKRLVAIRGISFPPMNLPNVPRNVIAHELGHAIGLRHNSDPTTLMCGRPAPCRPGLFRSEQPHMFPLTDAEKRRLLAMYPPQLKPQLR
jgi:Dual-action HEIGH metallo-peptidase